MTRLWFRFRAMLRRIWDRDPMDQELSEEIRTYVEHETDSKVRSGMTPDDARRAALIELGGADQIKEHVREDRAGAWWDGIFRDTLYALRSLGRAWGFSGAVVASLSLGLAATILAMALINGLMLRPLPAVQNQDRLVEIGILNLTGFGWGLRRTAWTDYPDVVRALEGMPSLEGLASFTESKVAATLPQARSLQAAFVSRNYFDVLGVRPEIGRTFAADEGRIESASVAVISQALWMREFGGVPSVIGRPIRAGDQTFVIIGVAPQGFAGTTRNVDLWLPIVFTDLLAINDRSGSSGSGGFNAVDLNDSNPARKIRYVGRLRDGVGVGRVETELGVVAAGIVKSSDDPEKPFRTEVLGLSRFDSWDEAALIALIPALVLVIAGVNAANLLLVRASRRGREIALRLALGAARLRVVRQLVIESVMLAMVAALVALGLAWWGLNLFAVYVPYPVALDRTVVAGALGTAFLTALAFGIAPAFQATRQDPSRALGTSPAGSGGTRSQSGIRKVLVAGQVALSLGVLAIAFQLTSAVESLNEPPATNPDRLLLASFDLEELRFSTGQSNAFYSALLDRVSKLPGVEAAGLSGRDLLWSRGGPFANFYYVDPGPEGRPRFQPVLGGSAAGDLFSALAIEVVQGRGFAEADWRDAPEVAIVTERLASELFDGPALGRSLHVTEPGNGAPPASVQIVGIVESPEELTGQDVSAIFFPAPFLPSPRQSGAARTLYIRAESPAGPLTPAIRGLVAEIDPRVPILELATLDQKVRADYRAKLVMSRLAALLGIVALLLASIGLYGVTSYSVAMRAREIAVRMALGARSGSVLVMVLRQAATLVMIGSAIGAVLSIVVGRLIQAEIFGVPAVPFATLGGSAALLAAAMLLASILPARRAARLDPNLVLREE
jgi:putative ABC transport system permease protein